MDNHNNVQAREMLRVHTKTKIQNCTSVVSVELYFQIDWLLTQVKACYRIWPYVDWLYARNNLAVEAKWAV